MLPNGCIVGFIGFTWCFIGAMPAFVQPVVSFDMEAPIPSWGGQPTADPVRPIETVGSRYAPRNPCLL